MVLNFSILSQCFIVKLFNKSLLLRILQKDDPKRVEVSGSKLRVLFFTNRAESRRIVTGIRGHDSLEIFILGDCKIRLER